MNDAELLDRIARLKEVADSSVSHDTVAHYIASPAGCTYLEQLTEDAEFLLSVARDGLRLRAAPVANFYLSMHKVPNNHLHGCSPKDDSRLIGFSGQRVRIVPEESNV